jgi:hypothetical protein
LYNSNNNVENKAYKNGSHDIKNGVKKSIQPRMDGTEGSVDRRLHLPYFLGHLKRTSDDSNGVCMSHYDKNKV